MVASVFNAFKDAFKACFLLAQGLYENWECIPILSYWAHTDYSFFYFQMRMIENPLKREKCIQKYPDFRFPNFSTT